MGVRDSSQKATVATMASTLGARWLWIAFIGVACASGDGERDRGSTGLPMNTTATDGETHGTGSAADTDTSGSGSADSGGETQAGGDTDSDGETGGVSPCAIEGTEVWRRHAYRFATGTWDTPQPLDEVWVGPGAPPPRGIVAAASPVLSQRLFVMTESGCLHERVGAQWVEMPLGERFVEASGSSPNMATAARWPDHDELTLIDNPTARVYNLSDQAEIVGEPLVVTLDDEDMGPPHATGTALWGFAMTDPELIDISAWYNAYYFYDDGMLYWYNAGTAQAPGNGWSSHVAQGGTNPIFQGSSANEPDPAQIRAAYYSVQADRVYFVGP
jgi:hypothetical protein